LKVEGFVAKTTSNLQPVTFNHIDEETITSKTPSGDE